MFLRTASERDLEAVRDLLVETWHDTYDSIYGAERVKQITDEWHSIPALKTRLERIDSEFLLADNGEEIAGMAFASAIDGGATVMLYQLYVRPKHQGRGIGGLLLDEVEESFPEAVRIRLQVEEANTKAVAFYLANGFAKMDAASSHKDAVIYERPLPRSIV